MISTTILGTNTNNRVYSVESFKSSHMSIARTKSLKMSKTVRLQLLLSCEDLPRSTVLRKPPNAFCVVATVTDSGSVLGIQRHRIGVTEIIPQSCSPDFCKVIILNHRLGTEQKIAIDIFHSKNKNVGLPLEQDNTNIVHRGMPQGEYIEALGSSVFDVEAILSQRDFCLTDRLVKGGKVRVRVEVSKETNVVGSFRFHFRGIDLTNTRRNFMERPNFYLEINRKQRGHGQDFWHPVYRTKITTLTLNPFWEMDEVTLEIFCNNDLNRDLRLIILDLDGGNRKPLGLIDTTPAAILENKATLGNADDSKAYMLRKEVDSHVISNKFGKLLVLKAEVLYQETAFSEAYCHPMAEAIAVQVMPAPNHHVNTFDDIKERCTIALILAIDFTKNNGEVTTPGTSHHRGTGLNDYQWVMTTLGSAIGSYSKSHEIPVFGFGGQYQGRQYDIFQCGSQSKVKGVTGLLEAYDYVFSTGIMFGDDCKFDNVIIAAARQAQNDWNVAQGQSKVIYSVLLVLTTGSERDVLAAKEKLVEASASPLSVIFVRIDNSQRQLFGDTKIRTYLSRNQGRSCCHCIDGKEFSINRDSRALSVSVIDKIHGDILFYLKSKQLL